MLLLNRLVPSKIKTVILVDDSSSVGVIFNTSETGPNDTQMYDRLWPIAGNVSILVRGIIMT